MKVSVNKAGAMLCFVASLMSNRYRTRSASGGINLADPALDYVKRNACLGFEVRWI